MQPDPQSSSSLAESAHVDHSTPSWKLDLDLDAELDLICPGCGADLSSSESFATFRICSACGRHFSLPARERLALLVDPDSFTETHAVLVSADPLRFQNDPPMTEAHAGESVDTVTGGVLTGTGTIDGSPVIAIVLDLAVLGAAIGVVAGEKITLGLELAFEQRLPAVVVCASGRNPIRSQDGVLALAQHAKIVSATSQLKRAGVPLIAVLTDPTVGGVFSGLACHADVVFAEPGAHIGADGHGEVAGGTPVPGGAGQTVEDALDRGLLDGVIARPHLKQELGTLLGLLHHRGALHPRSAADTRATAAPASGTGPASDAVALARHADRPTASTYLDRIFTDVVRLRGDRVEGDAREIDCALGRLGGATVAVVGQERGASSAAGFRKVERLLRLAGHLELPVVILVDSSGATHPESQRDRLVGALGQTMQLLALLPVPVVAAIVGEAAGETAMALCVGDRLVMLEHAVFTPVAPDLVRVPERLGSTTRSVTARECLRLGLIDAVVPEPAPAAHVDHASAGKCLEEVLVTVLAEARSLGPRRLVDERSRRLRHLGQTTPEGRAAATREVAHLQELQRNLARSLAEWRERWEERSRRGQWRGRPQFHLPRPDLAGKIASIRGHASGEHPHAQSK